jgi:hypothetical protein
MPNQISHKDVITNTLCFLDTAPSCVSERSIELTIIVTPWIMTAENMVIVVVVMSLYVHQYLTLPPI